MKSYKIFGKEVASRESIESLAAAINNISSGTIVPSGQTQVDVTKKYNEQGQEFATTGETPQVYQKYFGSGDTPNIITASNPYFMTGYIPVNKGDKYRISGCLRCDLHAVVGFGDSPDFQIGDTIIRPQDLEDKNTSKNITINENGSSWWLFDKYEFSITSDDIKFIRFSAAGKEHESNRSDKEMSIELVVKGSGEIPSGEGNSWEIGTDLSKMYDENGDAFAEGSEDWFQEWFGGEDFSATIATNPYMMTGYIPVREGDKFKLRGVVRKDGGRPSVVAYDTNKEPVYNAVVLYGKEDSSTYESLSNGWGKLMDYEFTVEQPEGKNAVKYIRYSAALGDHQSYKTTWGEPYSVYIKYAGYVAPKQNRSFLGMLNDTLDIPSQSGNGLFSMQQKGQGASASGQFSSAFGINTESKNVGEASFGKFNKSETGNSDADTTVFSIGIGSDDENRRNAWEVRQNGDIYLWVNGSKVLLQSLLAGIIPSQSSYAVSETENEAWEGVTIPSEGDDYYYYYSEIGDFDPLPGE